MDEWVNEQEQPILAYALHLCVSKFNVDLLMFKFMMQ